MLLIRLMGGRLASFHAAARNASEQVSGLLAQLLNGVQALQVASAEDAAVARLDQLGETRRRATVRDEVLNTFVRSMSDTTVSLTTGLILIVAAGMRQSGDFTVGDLALFVSYVAGGGVVQEIVEWLGRLMRSLKRADVSMARLGELAPASERNGLIDSKPPHLHGALPEPVAPVRSDADTLRELKISGLTYRHAENSRGVSDINLTLHRGSFTVITGRIGAGKSVLLQTLLGLLPKESGEIIWNGQPVPEPARFFTPPRCAYTPQTPRLFSETVRDNILMGLPANERELEDALSAAVLEADIAHLEEGLDTLVGPRGVKLSGGQMQRTAAARMFVRNAELLVFDDLSSALDVETEQKLWERLFARSVRPTCLVVSHRRAALQHASYIVVLKDGKVEGEGTLDELLVRCAEMRRLWHGEVDL
jgi:ATP-binding cassette subfamily B protein